jgi:hypothetical protein
MRGDLSPLLQYVFVLWCLIKQWTGLHGVKLSEAQGRLYFCLSFLRTLCQVQRLHGDSVFAEFLRLQTGDPIRRK